MACEHCPTCGGDTQLIDDKHKAVLPKGEQVHSHLIQLKQLAKDLSEEHQSRPGSLDENQLIDQMLKLLRVQPSKKPRLTVAECRSRLHKQLNT